MSTAALKRELALLRSSLAALTPAQSATLADPVAWAERIAGLTLDPWQRDVLLSAAPRLGQQLPQNLNCLSVVLPGKNNIVPNIKTITDRAVSDRRGLRWHVLLREEVRMSDTFEKLMNGADGGLALVRVWPNRFNLILITNSSTEGKIIYANEAFEKLTGHDPSSVIGKTRRLLPSGFFPEMGA